jgi:acetylornithine deacetylase/succinyl-diaminopimelate desuccinylase-like protein
VTVALVQADFTTWTGVHYEVPEFCSAWWTDETTPTAQRAAAALVDAGLDPTPTHYSFCTNGSLTAGILGLPTIGFGVGLEHLAHQVDEFVTLDSLRAGERGFRTLSRRLTVGLDG